MPHSDTSKPFDDLTQKLIKGTVRTMMRKTGLPHQYGDDFYQELVLRLLQALPQYDPHRGDYHAFVRIILNSQASKVLRDRLAQKRDDRSVRSLQEPAMNSSGEATELGELITEQDLQRRLGRTLSSEQRRADLKLDLESALDELTPAQRNLAKQLQTHSAREIAETEAVDPSAISHRKQALRRSFEKSGLRDYLSKKANRS